MSRKNKCLMLLPLLVLLVFSCDNKKEKRIFDQNNILEDIEWKRSDVLHYEFDIEDTSKQYNISFNIRHANMYPFANILFNLRLESPGGSTRVKDFEVFLRNSDGEFLGDGLGDYWDFKVEGMNGIRFAEPGKWKADVEHYMPMDIVPGIMEFGFFIDLVDQEAAKK